MHYEEKILEICEQYKASDLYSKILRDMQTLMNTCSKKEEMMDRLQELAADIFPDRPEELYRNLRFMLMVTWY